MSEAHSESAAAGLAALRQNIDRIDEAIHRLLMERGQIIENLIATKARQGGGSAFRPGREAEMMRRLVQRHAGLLPLDTVESIWRIIIGTFTFVQANYAIHVDVSAGDAAMRDGRVSTSAFRRLSCRITGPRRSSPPSQAQSAISASSALRPASATGPGGHV